MYPPSAILRSAGFDPEEVRRSLALVDLDRVPVRPAPRWMRRIWVGDVGAMTLPWGIFVDPDLLGTDPPRVAPVILHELVHVRQWGEEGAARFLGGYLGAYLRARLRGRSHRSAYEGIPAEREARAVTTALTQG